MVERLDPFWEVVMRHEHQPAESDRTSRRTDVSILTNGVTWYMRSTVAADGDRLRATTPRTVLGFLPTGMKQLDEDLRDVARIAVGTKLYPDRLAVALGLGLLAWLVDLGALGTIIVAFAAVGMLLLSFIAVLRIDVRSGRSFLIPVCLAHLGRAKRFVADVEVRSAEQMEMTR
jgi:hypothetical protein